MNNNGGLFRADVQIAYLRTAKIIADQGALNKAMTGKKKKEKEEAMQVDAMVALGK